MFVLNRFPLLASLGVALGCATGASPVAAASPTLQVSLVSSTGSTLPTGSDIEVMLVDVTLSGAAMRVSGTVTKDKSFLARIVYDKGSPPAPVLLPLQLELAYNSESVVFDHRYAVSAQVTNAAGTLLKVGNAVCNVPSPGKLSDVQVTLEDPPAR